MLRLQRFPAKDVLTTSLQAAQVAVASLGLCYSTDTADQHALMIPGQIYAPDLTELQAGGLVSVKTVNLGAQQYTANRYSCPASIL